ncbi:virulence factor BrkB family protein [Candidatus Venteria ishoeyi]|uniref:UPF0761 membrane protein MBHS_00814 n=1 Tax=Candidatus Venteria ishoeyi TaxID=1899563 RepID=A0A1H6F6F7_9GAMM|nr:virulence factor BrkB family protein [Candidatus Venteria ishoeyi]SEH04961.1 Uncharacterised protein [Candidatus Venteria ishoeyi]
MDIQRYQEWEQRFFHKLPPAIRTFLQNISGFLHLLVLRFVEDRCITQASALAYTTLLSLVPLMTLVFGMLSAFPAFSEIQNDIQHFIFENFVPASGAVVQDYLENFTQKTSQLTAIGIAFLIITALLMVKTIDKALNTIWHSNRSRNPVTSFLVYWSILTVAPLLIGISVFVTSYLTSLSLWSDVVERHLGLQVLNILPFVTSATAFTLLYMLIPNRRVPMFYALLGGICAALLFDMAKRGFALYVTQSPVYETIYGALSTIPLFLIWIYASWIMILFGAEVTYCLTIYRRSEYHNQKLSGYSNFIYSYRLLGHLWEAQQQGSTLSLEVILSREGWQNELRLMDMLRRLKRHHWVYRGVEGDEWGLARDLGEVALLDLYKMMVSGIFDTYPELPDKHQSWNKNLEQTLEPIRALTEQEMNKPLKTFYSQHLDIQEK